MYVQKGIGRAGHRLCGIDLQGFSHAPDKAGLARTQLPMKGYEVAGFKPAAEGSPQCNGFLFIVGYDRRQFIPA
jgi:hypothetical protein